LKHISLTGTLKIVFPEVVFNILNDCFLFGMSVTQKRWIPDFFSASKVKRRRRHICLFVQTMSGP